MSPRCPRCPPVLLALLLGLAQSQGSQECRDQDVTAGASLCLVPEELPPDLQEIGWGGKTDFWSPIMIAPRDGSVSYPEGSFHGRAEFQPAILSLCVSPVHKADSSVYRAEFENSVGNFEIFPRCFQVFLWDPILEPDLKSQIQHWNRGWCSLSLLCSSPGTRNVSIRWECPKDSLGLLEFPGSLPQLIQKIPENAKLQICHCNWSSPAGWRAAQASCTCAEIFGNSGLWKVLVPILVVVLVVVLVILGIYYWWRRRKRRRENSEEFL